MARAPDRSSVRQARHSDNGPAPDGRGVGSPAAATTVRQRRRGWLLLGASAWNTWLFTTRIWNLLTGPELETRSTGFVVVHMVLYVASLAIGAMVGVIGWRLRREDAERRGGAFPRVAGRHGDARDGDGRDVDDGGG